LALEVGPRPPAGLAWKGWNVVGKDYGRVIELSPNSVEGHAQCAKGFDDQRFFEKAGSQTLLN